LHALRHTLLSRLDANGVGVGVISRAANHADMGTTAGYIHPGMTAVRAALEANAEQLLALVGP
jgi:integrase